MQLSYLRLSAGMACLILLMWTGAQAEITGVETFGPKPGFPSKIELPDRHGLNHDTRYFLGYQWVTIALLYAAPESVSGWTEEQKEGYSMSVWWDNVTHVKMDTDDFYINYVLHPYWGAAYFVRAKERGYGDKKAFWYSALLSSIYEFGAEALFEEPSIQDLIVTPVFGSLLGQYFMRVRHDIRDRETELGYRSTRDKWVWTLTDPLGALNDRFDRLFGRETQLRLQPYRYSQSRDPMRPSAPAETVYGLAVEFRW